MKKLNLLYVLILTVMVIRPVYAGSAANTLVITGNVATSCTMTVGAINLPGSISSSQNATTNLNVNCSNTLPYNLTVSSANAWNLKNSGTDLVAYALAYTGAFSGVNATWSGGNGTSQVTSSSQTGTGANQVYPLRVTTVAPTGLIAAGSYSDQVTITVNY